MNYECLVRKTMNGGYICVFAGKEYSFTTLKQVSDFLKQQWEPGT